MHHAIVIGAGPAGLQAGLTLGRMHRSVLLLDSGEYRNAGVAHMHNVIGDDGTEPSAFRARAREQLAAYPTVELRAATATDVSRAAGGFRTTLSDGSSAGGAHVLLATGLVDELPDVPGLDALWGRHAFGCPFCDGHEFAGLSIGILGADARAAHLTAMLGSVVDAITVFPLAGAEPASAPLPAPARLHPAPVTGVEEGPDGVLVHTDSGAAAVAGLFVAAGALRQRAPFADRLGLRMLPSGAIEIDDFGRTSAPGVWAAGDLAHRASLPGPMASVVQAAAAGQTAASMIVRELAEG